MRNLCIAVLAALSLSGCAAGTWLASPPVGGPPVVIQTDVNEFGARIDVNFNWPTFLATRSSPKIEYQNQAGGWEDATSKGWIDLPYSQGGMNFRVTPNGHFESYEATIDGVLVGCGGGLQFGFGTGTKDNGKHLLRITIRRSYDPDLGDPVPSHFVETKVYKIIVFYKASY